MTKDELIVTAFEYLEFNPERFNDQEKMKFMSDLQEWMSGKSETISDEVYDFLVMINATKSKAREVVFHNYINEKYGYLAFRRVLDVGAGRMCKFSNLLAKNGAKVTAMDPKIRLTEEEADKKNIIIKKDIFECDEFARYGSGTNVTPYDLIVGLEPCEATEHIIRQGLKHDKSFDVLLCAAPHDALNGRSFDSYKDWYKHLKSISSEVEIVKYGNDFIATNDKQMHNELGK